MTNPELTLLLDEAKRLATRYYRLTGKPLGITGEVAELECARLLGLELAPAGTTGYDAIKCADGVSIRVQIKGRAVDAARRYVGRCPSIKCGDLFDTVMLVLLDRATLQPLEIWEASESAVATRLQAPGSKSRNERSSMGLSQFKSIAQRIWCAEAA